MRIPFRSVDVSLPVPEMCCAAVLLACRDRLRDTAIAGSCAASLATRNALRRNVSRPRSGASGRSFDAVYAIASHDSERPRRMMADSCPVEFRHS